MHANNDFNNTNSNYVSQMYLCSTTMHVACVYIFSTTGTRVSLYCAANCISDISDEFVFTSDGMELTGC